MKKKMNKVIAIRKVKKDKNLQKNKRKNHLKIMIQTLSKKLNTNQQ